MTARFAFTEEAETQILEIVDYLAGESESAAIRVRDAIYDAVANWLTGRASATPVKIDGSAGEVLGRLFVSPRYDPLSRPLTIVLHGARDVEWLLKR